MQMKIIRGPGIAKYIDCLGKFRISIFRDFPYLYDGDISYERKYLGRYAQSESAVLCLVDDEHGLRAACTGIPLRDEEDASKSVFSVEEVANIFYIGEVMIRADARRGGLGQKLLSEMIDLAAADGYRQIVLFTVDRGFDPPLRPERYWSPEPLWRKFGFERDPEKRVLFSWKDVGSDVATAKPMSVWIRSGQGC